MRVKKKLTRIRRLEKSEPREQGLLNALKAGEEDIAAGRCRLNTDNLFREIICYDPEHQSVIVFS
jgi:hypothetical protein